MDGGDLVRLTIDGGAIQGNRFFARNRAGHLQAGGPFTVLGVEPAVAAAPETPAPLRVARRPHGGAARGLVTVHRPVPTGGAPAGTAL